MSWLASFPAFAVNSKLPTDRRPVSLVFQRSNNMANSLENIITNPGLEHLGLSILRHLNTKTLLNLRLVNHSCKYFVENPRFWLKKLKYMQSGSMEIYKAWSSLILKVEEEENFDLDQNVVLNLIKLLNCFQQSWVPFKFLPLNVFSLFGDLPMVKFMTKTNMVENLSRKSVSKFIEEWTPVHLAAERGHTEIVKALIECTGNPIVPNTYGETPIHCAAKHGYSEIVKTLIAFTDNPNAPNHFGYTPISFAADKGHTEIVKILIECTDIPNAPDNYGRTPIHDAAKNGHTESLKALIACTDNPNAPDNGGSTPIFEAAMNGHIEIVKTLIERVENPNAPKNDGRTPIHIAAAKGHIEIVKILIECTDRPNAPDNSGNTPIHCAASNGHTEIVKNLIGYTDNPNTPNHYGMTPYELAQLNDHVETMKFFESVFDIDKSTIYLNIMFIS